MENTVEPNKIFRLLEKASVQSSAEYFDARLQEIDKKHANIDKYNNFSLVSEKELGVGIRFLVSGNWGFASSTLKDLTDYETIRNVIKDAQSLASIKIPGKREKVQLSPTPREYKSNVLLTPDSNRIAPNEKIQSYLSTLKNQLEKKENSLAINCQIERESKLFLSSLKSVIIQKRIRHITKFKAMLNNHVLSKTCGGLGNVSTKTFDRDLIEGMELLNQSIESYSKAVVPRTNRYTVMLSPQVSWLVIHESLGHAIEGDTVVEGKSLFNKESLGYKIASDNITVVDDPTIATIGSFSFDDDGIKAAGNIIIEEGFFTDFLHSRETAGSLGMLSTGNSIANNYSDFPLVRMSNFFLEPGDADINELRDFTGIYLEMGGAGSSQPYSGEFRIPILLGYKIENGEIKETLRNFFIVDDVLNFLKNIELVGSKIESHINECGKNGQTILQGNVSPYIRVKNVHISGV